MISTNLPSRSSSLTSSKPPSRPDDVALGERLSFEHGDHADDIAALSARGDGDDREGLRSQSEAGRPEVVAIVDGRDIGSHRLAVDRLGRDDEEGDRMNRRKRSRW